MIFQNVDPLQSQVRIVDPKTGLPTPQFMRLWQQTFQNADVTNGGLAGKVDKTTEVIAGTALDGGGALANNVTIDHANSAVTPGTYGDATNVPQFTVDQQGHVTGVTEVPISGGGGGGLTLLASWNGSVDPPIATLAAPISGLNYVEIRAWDVTKAALGWIGGDFSYDGGVTWPFTLSDYLRAWPITGIVPAAGGGDDVRWFLHTTAASAVRTVVAQLWGAGHVGVKKYVTTRDPSGCVLNRNAPTHLRVAAILSPAVANNNTTFTGGRIEIWGS